MCVVKTLGTESESVKRSLTSYTYEEAIEHAHVGKFQYVLLLTAGLCFMAFITELSGLGFIMFPAKCDLQFSLIEQGLLGSAGFLGVTISAHAMGFLADTWGRLRTLKTMIAISLCTSLISSLSPNVWLLFIFRLLTGVFISGCQACVFSLVGEFHGFRTRVKHVALVSMFLPFGTVFLPGFAIYILPLNINFNLFGIQLLPWRILMLVNLIPSFIALIGCNFISESPKWLLGQGRHEECVEILRGIYSTNTGLPRTTYPCNIVTLKDTGSNLSNVKGFTDAVKLISSQTTALFRKGRALQTVNMCFITFMINFIAQGIYLYFPIIINNLLATSGRDTTVCEAMELVGHSTTNRTLDEICADPSSLNIQQYEFLFAMGCCFAFFYFFISNIINFTGKKPLFICWLFIGGTCSLLLYWINSFYLILVVLTMIVAIANCVGVMTTFALEFYPTSINAMGVSFVMMVGRFGAVVGTNSVGPVLHSNCDSLFFAFTGAIAFLVLLAFFLPRGSSK